MLRTITIASALLLIAGCSDDTERGVTSTESANAPIATGPTNSTTGDSDAPALPALSDNSLMDMDMAGMMGGIDTTTDPATAPQPAVMVTGEEPECLAGFGRVAECYLNRDTCDAAAPSRAEEFGYLLSVVNCPALNDMGVAPNLLAMFLNAETDCDDPDIVANTDMFDMGPIGDLCTAPAMTVEDCSSACNNIVPCAGQFMVPDFQTALGNETGCNANCMMDPLNVLGYPCTSESPECGDVVACFEGDAMP